MRSRVLNPQKMAIILALFQILIFGAAVWTISSQQLSVRDEVLRSSLQQKWQWSELGNVSTLFLSDEECVTNSICQNPQNIKSRVLPKWDDVNCRCDDACATYGDCCIDARIYNPEQARLTLHQWKCNKMVEYQGLYMMASCPATWADPQVLALCEQGVLQDTHKAADPLTMTPVTNLKSRFTYQNYYCAMCHEDTEGAIFWVLRIECQDLQQYNNTYGNVTDEFTWSNLRFDETSGHWGIRLENFTFTRSLPLGKENTTFVSCRTLVQMPANVVDLVRNCRPWIDDCPTHYSDHRVRHLCHSYTAAVFQSGFSVNSYRNIHCALCNDIDPDSLSCQAQLEYRFANKNIFNPSFAFLFDINEKSGDVVGTTRRCQLKDEIYDPFFQTCREMVCVNPRHSLRQGRCEPTTVPEPKTTKQATLTPSVEVISSTITAVPSTQITLLSTKPTIATAKPNDQIISTTVTIFTTDFKNIYSDCPRFNISHLWYRMFTNGTVYINEYNRFYTAEEYIALDDGSILICVPESDNVEYLYQRKFSVVLAYLTLACLSVSLTCIVVHLLAFLAIPSLRNLSGKNLASLCVALVAAYTTFIIMQFDGAVSSEVCTVIAVILYYSFLASFFWMNCIAFDVWRTLRLATSELRISSGQQWRKFVLYSSYAWLGPAIVVAIAVIVENTPTVPHVFRPSFGKVICWFGSRRALLIFFVVPVVSLVLVNALLFLMSSHIILSTTQSSVVQPSNGKARRNFKLYLRLALIMGLTWIFGIIASQVDREPLWYAFVIFNALQGLFIFVSFTCTDKVRASLRDGTLFKKSTSYYSSSRGAFSARKFELEGRDSGSGESQSSQTSDLSLAHSSQLSKKSCAPLY